MNAPTRARTANTGFRPSRIALGVLLALGAAAGAQAQSLVELYEAERTELT